MTYCRRRGSARAQVFGNHGTVRAQGSLGNTKWAWGPYWRWSRHPDESWTHLQQLDSTEDTQKPSSEIGFENWVWALLDPPNLSVGLRVCLYFITLWLLSYFLITVWLHTFHFYFYRLCTLVLLMFLTLGNELAIKWKIFTNIHSK